MKHLVRWLIGVVTILITVRIVQALGLPLNWPDLWGMVIFVPILAVVNVIIGTIVRLLSMPINCMTFGLFSFVINAILFWGAGSATGARMTFLSALAGSILYGVISTLLSSLVKENRRREQ
ncbi:MAG: phage holin family protein [Armatimonadetes bacterium]|nr:phage holin family protein [Armatimonadota bacterium]